MAEKRKPIPKSQAELSQDSITPYTSVGKTPVQDLQKRQNQKSLKGDDVRQFSVGLEDVDSAISYYFNNVIRPSVIQNGIKINVPIMYGSPERWAAVQKDGFYRDRNGKIQTPLIMFKRDSVEKNRALGNKMDANNPLHFGIFEKKYSKKNTYDRFSILQNRIPVQEFYGVIIPDYVNLVYSCTIFTEYVEQMNKIVESINFASDSYWGDPERFKFRASIDTYSTTTQLTDKQDRAVKSTFQIKMAGYIVSDQINTSIINPNKFYSKAALSFNLETAGTQEVLTALAKTPVETSPNRFYDNNIGGKINVEITNNIYGATTDSVYLSTSITKIADTIVSGSIAVFTGAQVLQPPTGSTLPSSSIANFTVYVNGQYIPSTYLTLTSGSNTLFAFDTGSIGYSLIPTDEVSATGKFQ